MRQKLLNLPAAASLVLVLAVGWLWVSSYTHEATLVESRRGQFVLISLDVPPALAHASRDRYTLEGFLATLLRTGPAPHELRLLGFWFVRGDSGGIAMPDDQPGIRYARCYFWIIAVPYWFVAVLTLIGPVWWIARQRRRAGRRQSDTCANCGYDLRATPERCPECGAVPERAPRTAA